MIDQTKQIRNVFDKVSPNYHHGWLRRSRGVDGYIHRMQVWSIFKSGLMDARLPARVLDIGGGGGRMTIEFANRGNHVVYVDLSEKMANLARNEIKEDRLAGKVSMVIANANHLPFKNCVFDTAHSAETIQYFSDRVAFLKESIRVCRDGGLVICCCMNNSQAWLWEQVKRLRGRLGKDSYASIEYEFSVESFERDLDEAELKNVDFRGFVFFPPYSYGFFKIPGPKFWFPWIAQIFQPIEKVLSNSRLKYWGRVVVFVGSVDNGKLKVTTF